MSKTKMFRDQHDDLLATATKLRSELRADRIAKDPGPARRCVMQLVGKLGVHLSMEDKSLYPMLVQHHDPSVRAVASRFLTEMGGIAKALADYQKTWSSEAEMKADPQGFVKQTGAVLEALGKRVQRENSELYRLVDSLG